MIWDSSACKHGRWRGMEVFVVHNWSGKNPQVLHYFLLLHCLQESLKWKWASPRKKFQRGLCWLPLFLSPCPHRSRTPLEVGGEAEATDPPTARPAHYTNGSGALVPLLLALCTQHHRTLQSMAKTRLTFCFRLKLIPVSINCFESRPSRRGWLSQPALLRQVR